MSVRRMLIVNADDFGMSGGVNAGIVRAFTHGIVRSTSLMVHGAAAVEAAELARAHPALDVGLHLDVGEWRFEDGDWVANYLRAPADDGTLLERELDAQLARFYVLIGRQPTHIDSHQHAHQREPLRSILLARMAGMAVPIRHLSGHAAYRGEFYGQDVVGNPLVERVSADFLVGLIADLAPGTSELCCHPAAIADCGGVYAVERLWELQALCDPRVTVAVRTAQVELRSFATLT